jgi:serine/threonine-protein kinase HipA
MATFRAVNSIEVRIWDQMVGAIALDPRTTYYAFEYAPAFRRTGMELAPLTMNARRAVGPFVFPNLPELTFKRLPAALSDALPDDFGNALINAWMVRQGVAPEAVTPLDRLAYMGHRGMGALEFRPARGPEAGAHAAIKMGQLVEKARQAVQGTLDNDSHAAAALQQIISVGTSAGGARAKAVIAFNPNTREIRAGQFDVEPGFEHWLLKFDGVTKGDFELGLSAEFGRVEYAYHLMAVASGISMTECDLLEESGRAHFMTRRFDREGNQKHHIQSLCAMQEMDFKQLATHSYEQLFQTIKGGLGLPYEDLVEAYRRMVFNIMSANNDDHTKNFAFRLKQGGLWELAPAYDITHAYNPKGQWTYQHQMSVNGKFRDIAEDDLRTIAERFYIGNAREIIGEVRNAVSDWPLYSGAAGVEVGTGKLIAEDHRLLS